MFIVDGPHASFEPRHGRAIVSIVIGAEYQRIWRVMCQANWQAYAERHGYDLILVTDFIDGSARAAARSPAWQKLLILSQPWSSAYERIVWLDADIVISATAPDICNSVPDPNLVGVCMSGDQMSDADKHIYFERMHKMVVEPQFAATAWGFHEANRLAEDGIADEGVPMLNTGVLVLSPERHTEVFLETYAMAGNTRLYEQPHLSHELFKRGLIHRISARFNWIVQEVVVLHFPDLSLQADPAELAIVVRHIERELRKAYFLHFAGSMNLMAYMCALAEKAAVPA